MTKADELLAVLRPAVRHLCGDARIGIMFSGGIDSTVIAVLASEFTDVSLYTVGVGEAHDLAIAEETAKSLGLRWRAIRPTENEVLEAVLPLSALIGRESILPVSFEMPAYFVCMCGEERRYLNGQGADELFGGYMRYLSLSPEELRSSMKADLDALLIGGRSMERSIAVRFAKEIGHPYLDPDVVAFASKVSGSDCISGGSRKVILGEVASILGLEFLVGRQKKAAQYGSGVMKVLKAEARRRGVPVGRLVEVLKEEGQSV